MSFNIKCAGISVCILLQAVESLKKKNQLVDFAAEKKGINNVCSSDRKFVCKLNFTSCFTKFLGTLQPFWGMCRLTGLPTQMLAGPMQTYAL